MLSYPTATFLSDARFLVGLEGERTLLETLQAALEQPRWFLFFGRKAFLPAERVWLPDGLRDEPLEIITVRVSLSWRVMRRQPSACSC